MLRRIIIFCAVFNLAGCSNDPYGPDKFLSEKEQRKVIEQTVYFSHKLPPNANDQSRFEQQFQWYYDQAASESRLSQYHVADSGTHYFLITRKAKSITPMEEAIGGILKIDNEGKLIAYEEIFRTWKMPADTLSERGKFLFDRMVKGKDLTMYGSKYQADRFIEFPDDRFYFDKEQRRWRDRALDSLRIN